MSIDFKSFLEDVKCYLDWLVKEKGISEKEASELISVTSIKLQDLNKLELDSFFIGIPGIIVKEFLNNMKEFSFGTIDESKILDKEEYTILVESTHSIRSK